MTFNPSNPLYQKLIHACGGTGEAKELIDAIGGGGSGTVTTVSVVTANGVSGVVANPTTTPAITITLGDITPSSVAAVGTVTGSNISGTTSGTNTGDQTITLTSDVNGSGTGSFATTIAANAVTYAKFQQVGAVSLLGNPTGSLANASEITLGSGLAFSGTTLTASGSGGTVTTVSVVTANGVSGSVANPTTTPAITITLGAITPSSVAASGTVTGSNISGSTSGTNTGDQTITLTSDVTGSGTGSFATTISSHVVTYVKMQQESASTILGNPTNATANVSEITLGAGIGFFGTAGTQIDSNWTASVTNNMEIPTSSTMTIFDDPYVVNSGNVCILDSGALINLTLTDKFEDWVSSIAPNNVEIPPNCTKTVFDDPYVIPSNTVTILDDSAATALISLAVTDKFEDWQATTAPNNVEIPPDCAKTLFDSPYIVPSGTVTTLDSNALLNMEVTNGFGALLNIQIFTGINSAAGGNFTYYPNQAARLILVRMVGGGGQGGGAATGATNSAAGGGGGAGGYAQKILKAPFKSQYSLTVGSGGSGGGVGALGQSGTDSTFDSPSVCTAKAAGGGSNDTVAAGPRLGAIGGTGGNVALCVGDVVEGGNFGFQGIVLAAAQAVGGMGASSVYGGGGQGAPIQTNGSTAFGRGSGGGGACILSGGASTAGGAGGGGQVEVWEFS